MTSFKSVVCMFSLIVLASLIAAPAQAQPVPSDVVFKSDPSPRGEISIIEARFGAFNSWIDLTQELRSHVKQGQVNLPSLKPLMENLKDPAFGHHKAVVVVYQQGDAVRLKIVPSDGVDGAWGSLILPEQIHLLVVGNKSDNVIQFDLTNGRSTVLAKLATGSQPWGIAVNRQGEIFVGLRGLTKNIVRLGASSTGDSAGPLIANDLTERIGRFGPGLMAFDRRGLLNVAADTQRSVQRYDASCGRLVESMRLRSANLMGLTVTGDSVYAAENFQKSILRFNLVADPPAGESFITKSEHLDHAHGLTIGHNGNLFVSNLRNGLVQEFNIKTGDFVRTLIDVSTLGGGPVKALQYEPRLGRYFLTSGDVVYEVAPDGALTSRYRSEALCGALGIAFDPPAGL